MHSQKEEDGGVGEKGIFFSSPATVRRRRGTEISLFNVFLFGIINKKVTHENKYFIYINSFFICKRLHINCVVVIKT
jgi:hypothetical protein